jgi:branched-chain amino acid aminotransferase
MGQPHPAHIWLNGQLVAYADAKVHVLAPVVAYGAAAFEGLRAYWDADAAALHVFKLDQHLERLEQSMRLLSIDPIGDMGHVRQGVLDLLEANGTPEDQHIRVLAYIDGDEPAMSSTGPVSVAITALPRGRSEAAARASGVS